MAKPSKKKVSVNNKADTEVNFRLPVTLLVLLLLENQSLIDL
jgi:hypothetical protein